MLSRLVCRRNRGANGSKNAASSGSASGEALGTLLIFMLHSTTETNKVVIVRRSTTESADTCVTRFIERLYHASQEKAFDSAFFHDRYEAFEELFYSDQLRFLDTVRLHNFDSEVDEIGLEDGLAIKKLPLIQDDRTTIEEAEYRPHVQFSRSDFVVERRYIKPRLVGNR